jgi:hypothetical protein
VTAVTETPTQLRLADGVALTGPRLREARAHVDRAVRDAHRHLLTPGIATGLEVTADGPHTVVVAPGVALDDAGRVIVVDEPLRVAVQGTPSTVVGVPVGSYLALSAGEQTVGERVRDRPRTRWLARRPRPGSGQVLLAQAELAADGSVRALHGSVRVAVRRVRRVGAMCYALAGAKDLGPQVAKTLSFHVRGGRATRLQLTLRGAEFSPLHYSELGAHTHELTTEVGVPATPLALRHRHALTGRTSAALPEPEHRHEVRIEFGERAALLDEHDEEDETGWNTYLMQLGGGHTHRLENVSTTPGLGTVSHDHPVTLTSAVAPTGTTGPPASSQNRLRFPADLTVTWSRNGTQVPLTGPILDVLRVRDGAAAWARFGDGSGTHPLVTTGTGPVDLLALGVPAEPGEHRIIVSVPAGPPRVGGRIAYHLAVG